MTLDEFFGPKQPFVPNLPETASEVTICQHSREVIVVHGRGRTERITGEDAEYAIMALQTGDWAPKKPNSRHGATQYWRNR
jgi:hypothetical protein